MRLDPLTRQDASVRTRLMGIMMMCLSLTTIGCANATPASPQGGTSLDPTGYELPSGPQPDRGMWDRPLGEDALEATQARIEALSFDPVSPASLGAPQSAYVEDSADFGPLASIGWSLPLDDFPHVILIETPSGATQEELLAPTTATPGCTQADAPPNDGGSTVIECRGAGFSRIELKTVPARAVDGTEVVSITWLAPALGASKELRDMYAEPVIELTLMAPADEATSADLANLAIRMGY
jgi:hypothetical protein